MRRRLLTPLLLFVGLTVCASAQTASSEQAAAKIEQLLEANQAAQALDLAKPSAQQWPQDARLRHLLGLAYFKIGDLDNAAQELGQAIKLAPSSADQHYDLALVYLSQKKYPEAAAQLEASNRL